MGVRYVEVSSEAVAKTLELCEFVRADQNGCWEEVWVRPVTSSAGKEFPYEVRIYTSVDIRTGFSRECGEDAIRLVLWDKGTDRPVKAAEKRVYRTKNAMLNMVEGARELFRFVFSAQKCSCGGLMLERKGKNGPFLGCSRFPVCTKTAQIVNK